MLFPEAPWGHRRYFSTLQRRELLASSAGRLTVSAQREYLHAEGFLTCALRRTVSIVPSWASCNPAIECSQGS
jgi:hypothetical protein